MDFRSIGVPGKWGGGTGVKMEMEYGNRKYSRVVGRERYQEVQCMHPWFGYYRDKDSKSGTLSKDQPPPIHPYIHIYSLTA